MYVVTWNPHYCKELFALNFLTQYASVAGKSRSKKNQMDYYQV